MGIDIYASDQPLWTIQLERDVTEEETDLSVTLDLLEAADDFTRDWLIPLGVGILVECCNPDNFFNAVGRPAHSSWFLRVDDLNPQVQVWPAYAKSSELIAQNIGRTEILQMLESALAQNCSNGITSLAEFKWTAVRARLPHNEILVRCAGGVVTPLIDHLEGASWAFGPKMFQTIGPPAILQASKYFGSPSMTLAIYWDCWITNQDGKALVDKGLSRVQNRKGWRKSLSS